MSTFVSKNYRGFEPSEIEGYLRQKFGDVKRSGQNWTIKVCPWCHETHGKADNLNKCSFTVDTGAYRCVRCGAQGSYYDLKKHMGDLPAVTDARGNSVAKKVYNQPNQQAAASSAQAIVMLDDVPEYFAARGVKIETLKHYRVGASNYRFQDDNLPNSPWVEHLCMTFPWIEKDAKGGEIITRLKARSLTQKAFMRLDPAGGKWGWFGAHTIDKETQEICITEGEIDALSVWQETGMPTISLPNGSRSLPPELVQTLERFSKIVWWLDDDVAGAEGLNQFAEKVGRHRSWFIQTRRGKADGPKDANEALKRGFDLKELLASAKPVPHEQILTWDDLKDDVLRELINPDATAGQPFTSVPGLTKILRGHRRGELTIFTGPSGYGKTTWLSQLSLDLCRGGTSTLWGSFEIKNHRLAKKMLKQFAQKNLEKHLDEYAHWSEQFGQLPLFFMKFFGATNVDQALEAAKYCVYAHDVAHIVWDNLQFMTAHRGARGISKFDLQDEAIEKIRAFSTAENVHSTVVIHPKKVGEDIDIDTSMLGGTATAEQICDNMIILQRGQEYRYLDVKKNRYSGEIGKVPYVYDEETNCFRELTEGEMMRYSPSQRTSGARYGQRKAPKSKPAGHWSQKGGS